MLKSLVQLFAEKFLISKREWVQHIVSVGSQSIAFSIIADGKWHTLISSADGYVSYSGNTSGCILGIGYGGTGNIQNTSLETRCIIPVSKGQEFSYVVNSDSTVNFLYLIPMQAE